MIITPPPCSRVTQWCHNLLIGGETPKPLGHWLPQNMAINQFRLDRLWSKQEYCTLGRNLL